MADRPPDAGVGAEHDPTTGVPRWVKVFGIIAAVLVLLVVAVLLISGGEHGPGRHMSSGEGAPALGVAVARSSLAGAHG